MKVLHLINNLATGGAEKLILETIPLQNQAGISSDLLLLNGNSQPFLEELRKQNCCQIFSLGKGSVYNPFLIFKIIPYLKKYDIIHVHLFPSLYFAAIAKTLSFSNCKLIFTEHSTSNKRIRNTFYSQLDRIFYKPYSKIITISDKVDTLIKNHLKSKNDKFQLIQNGVNIQKINDANSIDFPFLPNREKYKILLQVSSFQYPKDQKTVIKSLKLLPNNVILFLVGAGELKLECEDFVKQENLFNRVFFLGQRMDVPNLLKSVDIVVLSSHYEGLSLSSIEGMASGKPFVATNVQGLKEVVIEAGLLFEKNDDLELSKHILNLLNNTEYYQSVVEKCRIRANSYDINNTVKQTIVLYNQVNHEK